MKEAEPPQGYVERCHFARKAHVCCECGTTIKRKEHYTFHSGVWKKQVDGVWKNDAARCQIYRMCDYCKDMTNKLAIQYGMLVPFGGLKDWLVEINDASMLDAFEQYKRKRMGGSGDSR